MRSWIRQYLHGKGFFILSLMILTLFQSPLLLAQGRPPTKVVVSAVIHDTIQDEIVLIGVVEPWRASTVAGEVSGRVEDLKVRRGQKVSRGQVLAQLDKSNLLLKLKEARARKDAAQARLERVRDVLERSERLKEGKLISDKDLRQARLNVQELEGDLAVTEAGILQRDDELGKKTIRAPFNGVITRELTEIGQWVEEGGDIVHMIDLSKVRIIVDIPEKYVSGVKENEEVMVEIDALGQQRFKGRIHALIPEGDKEAHVFPLEIHVKNKGSIIKEGMFAKIHFGLGLTRQAAMVHQDAIVTRGGQTYLFVVNGEEAKQVFVNTGRRKEDFIEVIGSLKTGEPVVIRGNERLRNGQPVQVVPPSE